METADYFPKPDVGQEGQNELKKKKRSRGSPAPPTMPDTYNREDKKLFVQHWLPGMN